MVSKNKKKMTENMIKVDIQEIDNMYLQDEFAQMQNVISEIMQQLSIADITQNRVETIYQLNQVCNNVLDQICMNLVIEEL